MMKVAAVVLTTGLLLGTVAFSALAQGQNTGDERCQKSGKVSCCEQEKRGAETAPWDKPTVGEQQKAEGCKCCRGDEAGNYAPPMQRVQRCKADEPGGEPGAESCGMDRERPGCGDRCGRDEAGNPPPPMKRLHRRGAADLRGEGPGPGGKRCGRDWERPGCGDRCGRDEAGNPPPPMGWEHQCMMEGGCHEGPGPEPMDREGKSRNERQKAVDEKPTSKMKPVHTCERCGLLLEMPLEDGPIPEPEPKP